MGLGERRGEVIRFNERGRMREGGRKIESQGGGEERREKKRICVASVSMHRTAVAREKCKV